MTAIFWGYLRSGVRKRNCGHCFDLACWMERLGPRLKPGLRGGVVSLDWGAPTWCRPVTFLTDWTGHILGSANILLRAA
jgi:hypothetical protein